MQRATFEPVLSGFESTGVAFSNVSRRLRRKETTTTGVFFLLNAAAMIGFEALIGFNEHLLPSVLFDSECLVLPRRLVSTGSQPQFGALLSPLS